jgi:hypothetical protein
MEVVTMSYLLIPSLHFFLFQVIEQHYCEFHQRHNEILFSPNRLNQIINVLKGKSFQKPQLQTNESIDLVEHQLQY